MATMAGYHGLSPKMTLAAAAFNESVFDQADALLRVAAVAAAARPADAARVAVLEQGRQHGLLTWRAFRATLNTTVCTSSLKRGAPCDEGYVGGGLDKGGGYAEACTCDVRALLAAARALAVFRRQLAASQAINVFWTQYNEMMEGKALGCNPCFGGYTGVHLAEFAHDLNASIALSVSRWFVRFDPTNIGKRQRWWAATTNDTGWHSETRIDMLWNASKAGAAYSAANDGKDFVGAGWYRLKFRLPWLPERPSAIGFSRGERVRHTMQLLPPTGAWALGDVTAWLNGQQLGTVAATEAAVRRTLELPVPGTAWVAGVQTLVLLVNGSGLSGRLWLV